MHYKKNILITGSSGFIGSNLLIYLKNLENNFKVNLLKYNSSEKSIDKKTKNSQLL